ncbi:HAD family hydrolase [uncultured Massilia sp.]|uniref:HAD family hydrolase n=1 Tax=uncultured Massilia sp. TaxID=169973 RepID=UPI0025F97B15|nr:HAD family hydrolase [uncultured Massilia sp.]
MPHPTPIHAIVFDVYGTLAEITQKRAPFRQLLRLGEQQSRVITANDAATLMSTPLTLREAAQHMAISLKPEELAHLEADLRIEIASLRLFPDTTPTLLALRDRNIKLALCSNLAADYAPPIMELLPLRLDAYAWSFAAGAIKPDPAIYAHVCAALGCAPANVLMVGDTPAADVDGPRAFGMQAVLLDRKGRRGDGDALRSLAELPALL